MLWFFVALLTPLLFAVVVHLDKYLISRYTESGITKGIGGLILYSSIFGLVVSAVLFLIHGTSVIKIPLSDIFILCLSGLSGITAVILYLYAMEKDEASIVAPLFQIVPIFGLIFEFVILGIVPTPLQIFGSVTIIVAGVLLVSEISNFRIKSIKTPVLLLMLGSSFFFALIAVLFKLVTVNGGNFWISSFWEYLSWGTIGLILFFFVESYRTDFLNSVKRNGLTIFGINIFGEIINIIANSAKNFSALLVPVALVYSVEALQPIFVLIFGIVITVFFPKISKEDISQKALLQKVFPISLMIFGTIIILL